MNKRSIDAEYMMRAIILAENGMGRTSPNPMVGAVIVKDNKIIGEGYHQAAGQPHAEINAIRSAKGSLKGSTMYVTLEPCVHYGRTPPCAKAIVESGIKRVVISDVDPNPLVNGRGINYLRRHKIEVDFCKISPFDSQTYSLNCGFNKWIKQKIPYVTLKVAMTMDGKIADKKGDSKYITSIESRRFVHYLRYLSDAILVGSTTVKSDDPLLNHRLVKFERRKAITRVILDGSLSLTPEYRVFKRDGARRILLTTADMFDRKKGVVKRFKNIGVEVVPFETDSSKIEITDILEYLGSINILYLFVEGGQEVFTDFLSHKEVDLLIMMISPRLLGEGSKGFYLKSNLMNNSKTNLSLIKFIPSGGDAILFYLKEGSDVYWIDRVYWKSLGTLKKV
ncbi:MAG: bifunctional diaminohydroxyphosphoribosylaminopyrimidine deaminase/5-amino-6-(5-phosphoribosylamino)uracil reductase RibD [Myxococcota bacterium]